MNKNQGYFFPNEWHLDYNFISSHDSSFINSAVYLKFHDADLIITVFILY